MTAHCDLALIHVNGPSTRSLFKIELANKSTFNRVGLRKLRFEFFGIGMPAIPKCRIT